MMKGGSGGRVLEQTDEARGLGGGRVVGDSQRQAGGCAAHALGPVAFYRVWQPLSRGLDHPLHRLYRAPDILFTRQQGRAPVRAFSGHPTALPLP